MELTVSKLKPLSEELERRIRIVGFSQKTIAEYRSTIRYLDLFMCENHEDEYSPDVGERFLFYENEHPPVSLFTVNKFHRSVISHLNICLEDDKFWVADFMLFSHSVQHNDLENLYDRLTTNMKLAGITGGSNRYVKLTVSRLDIFMTEYGFAQYSSDVGSKFINCMKELNLFSPENFRQEIETVIQRLNDCLNNITPTLRTRESHVFQNPEIEAIMKKTMFRLQCRGFSDTVIDNVKAAARNIDIFMVDQKISTYNPSVGISFLATSKHRKTIGKHDAWIVSAVAHINDTYANSPFTVYHLKRSRSAPIGFQHSLQSYLEESRQCGNADSTILNKEQSLIRFFCKAEDSGCQLPEELSAALVAATCAMLGSGDWGIVKGYLKFCASNAMTERDLSFAVPQLRRKSILPPEYSKEEREQLEKAPDRNTSLGKRDYAIILLVNRLALRSSDVVHLTFSNLLRSEKQIKFIQLKTKRPHVLPLTDEIEYAIDDYVNNGRPQSDTDQVFLMNHAPFLPLKSAAIHSIFTKYLRIAGVDINGRKHGGHAFRASAATAMVNGGMSYDETRYILGHSDDNAIKHYASLDVKNLRLCATAPLSPSGNFKQKLEQKKVISW